MDVKEFRRSFGPIIEASSEEVRLIGLHLLRNVVEYLMHNRRNRRMRWDLRGLRMRSTSEHRKQRNRRILAVFKNDYHRQSYVGYIYSSDLDAASNPSDKGPFLSKSQ
jgi:hypothetical protein